jgi:hypothetical protein
MRSLFYVLNLLLYSNILSANYFYLNQDHSPYIELLGNPYRSIYSETEQRYARNIWDMQLFQNRIYLGAGNSSNIGPAQNAGPVDIIYFDTDRQVFVNEYRVDDEQIDHFYIFNEMLYVPGHDPTQSWSWGNFYRKNSIHHQWTKVRNIPEAIHNYDMAYLDGKLFAALGTPDGAAIAVSDDMGESWQNINIGSSRAYTFISLMGHLFIIKTIRDDEYLQNRRYANVYYYNGSDAFAVSVATFNILFPQTTFSDNPYGKIVRVNQVSNNTSIYIGSYRHNDHQFYPIGVYTISDSEIKSIHFPQHLIPWDILIKGAYVAILSSENNGDGTYINKVFISRVDDLEHWYELVSFQYSTFARSFEFQNGDFYFGMGTEIEDPDNWSENELKEASGDILRLKYQYWSQ